MNHPRAITSPMPFAYHLPINRVDMLIAEAKKAKYCSIFVLRWHALKFDNSHQAAMFWYKHLDEIRKA